MKKISALLVMVLLLAMTVVPVSAADIEFKLSADKTVLAAGETVTLTIEYTPASTQLNSVDIFLDYDNTLVSFGKATGMTAGNVDDNTKKLVCYTDEYWEGSIGTVTFTALEDVNGNAAFTISATTCSDYDFNDYTDLAFAGVTVQVGDGGSSEPDPDPVFSATAEYNNGVVVTLANAPAAGIVYVATYDANDVLIDCKSADITTASEGKITFSDVAAGYDSALVFVWDSNNAPLLDAAVPVQ